MEYEELVIARQKRVSAATGQHITKEELLEAVFSLLSALRLCSKVDWENLVSRRLESAISSCEFQVSSGTSRLAVRNIHC
jgi:hypothetical protein